MPTLTTYRQNAAPLMGPYMASTAGAASTTGVLADTAWPVTSSLTQDSLFLDQFILRPAAATANKVRIVMNYVPSSGYLTPDTAWSVTPSAGEAYELHGVIEPWTAMNRLINEVLKRTMVVVNVTLTATAQQNTHSLSSFSWLVDPKWVYQVGWLTSSENPLQIDPFSRTVRGWAEKVDNVVWLRHPGAYFDANTTLYVKCIKQGYDHCAASGGTYGDKSGLSAETDFAEPEADWVAAGVRWIAYQQFKTLLATGDVKQAEAEQNEAAAKFTRLNRNYFTEPDRTFRPLAAWGPYGGQGRALGYW